MKRILWIIVWVGLSTAAVAQHGIKFSWTVSNTPGVTSQALYCGLTTGGENYVTAIITFSDNTTSSYLWTTGIAGNTYFCTGEADILKNGINYWSNPSNEASAVFPTIPAPQSGLTATAQ